MSDKNEEGNGELSTTVDGDVTDAPLHDHILDNDVANAKTRAQSRAIAVENGLSEKAATRMFGRNKGAR